MDNFLWISTPFSVIENSIYDDDMAAKIKFLQLLENACLKSDITREDVGKFWAATGI